MDTSITDLAVIEIDSNDCMNAFHDAGSCPICQALADNNSGQAVPYAESANHLAGSVASNYSTHGDSSGLASYFGLNAWKAGLSLADEIADPQDFLALSELASYEPKTAIEIIDRAVETLNQERPKLGAISNAIYVKRSLMNTQVVNLKDAQSRIVDTDFAQTMQTLIKGQVVQQAGLALLSVTNMSADLALRLLR